MLDKVKNTLKLIPSDFDTVEEDGQIVICDDQYISPWDCPIARALRRAYKARISVTCDYLSLDFKRRYTLNIGKDVVRQALKRLQKTGTYAVIRLFQKGNVPNEGYDY